MDERSLQQNIDVNGGIEVDSAVNDGNQEVGERESNMEASECKQQNVRR